MLAEAAASASTDGGAPPARSVAAAASASTGACASYLCKECGGSSICERWPVPFASPGGNAACARSAAHRTPCRCCTAAFLALATLPPVLANTDAAAAALLVLGAQPPVLVAVAFLAPAGRQTTRAHATRSEPNVVPIKAESRFQIPKKFGEIFGDGDQKRGAATAQISVTAFDFCRSALQISVKRSRFQIEQITSQRLCAGEK